MTIESTNTHPSMTYDPTRGTTTMPEVEPPEKAGEIPLTKNKKMETKVKIISKTLEDNQIVLALQDENKRVHSIFMPAEKDSVLPLGKTLILIVKDITEENDKAAK